MDSYISLPIKPTSIFLFDLCAQYAKEFPDPRQPIRSELVAALVPRVVRLLTARLFIAVILDKAFLTEFNLAPQEALKSLASPTPMQDVEELVSQIYELDSWLHEPGMDEMGCGNWLTDHGYSFEESHRILEQGRKSQTGRRPVRRKITVAALEAREEEGYSWAILADRFCACGKTKHDDLCREALRKSAAQLQSTLKKYKKIPVPADHFAQLSAEVLEMLRWTSSR